MAGTLDQSYTLGVASIVGGYSTGNEFSCQQITIGVKGVLSQIDLQLKKYGTGGGDYTVSIYSDDGSDAPDTLISDSVTFDPTTTTTSFAWYSINFTTQPLVDIGDKVWVSISRTSLDVSNFLYVGAGNPGSYAGGIMAEGTSIATVSERAGWDLNFKQYYEAAPSSGGSQWLNQVYQNVKN